MPASISFTLFILPTGQVAWIPDDIELRIPDKTALDPGNLHYLIYIPWHDKYLELVDEAYRDFFNLTAEMTASRNINPSNGRQVSVFFSQQPMLVPVDSEQGRKILSEKQAAVKAERKKRAWSLEKWCLIIGVILAALTFVWGVFVWLKPTQ